VQNSFDYKYQHNKKTRVSIECKKKKKKVAGEYTYLGRIVKKFPDQNF